MFHSFSYKYSYYFILFNFVNIIYKNNWLLFRYDDTKITICCMFLQADYSFSGLGDKTHSTDFSSGKSDSKYITKYSRHPFACAFTFTPFTPFLIHHL